MFKSHRRVGRGRAFWLALLCGFVALPTDKLLATVIIVESGMQFEGRVGELTSLNENPLNPNPNNGPRIVLIDDELTRTFVPKTPALRVAESPPVAQEKIMINQQVADAGQRIVTVGPIIQIGLWNKHGHRVFSMQGPHGQLDVMQGITEVTPTYTRVEGLRAKSSYVWDMRVATSSIPSEVLSQVLRKQIDMNNPDERLRIVRFYLQAELYAEALRELDSAITAFPDLASLKDQADRMRQLLAQSLLREIELRRSAGQHERVVALLNNFPEKGIAGVTLVTVRDLLAEYEKRLEQRSQAIELLKQNIELIEDEPTRTKLAAIHTEIEGELNLHNLNRMADFLRLSDDAALKPDQKVSLAISGWLLGSGAAIDNLAVASSMLEARDEAQKYLSATRPHERDEALERMRALEGATPSYLAQIIANMKPPIATDASELDTPGLYELTVPGIEEQADFSYYIQLPPEYNPYRRYPCIVTLNGAGTSELQQLDWWAGTYNEQARMRDGQASRRGYIVIAPKWQKPFQRDYEFTLREHAAVLFTLRDACRRASIDTDRVFLSGHSMGGEAAWDIALSHPDLWAGVIPIVANSGRYVHKYSENAKALSLYFVGGERDNAWLNNNGMELDRYLEADYDVTIVQYLGRGHEHFSDEIQRIFEWMELPSHRRNPFPREITALTMRPWDNYFWWLELSDIPDRSISLPAEGNERTVRPIKTVAEILDTNRITVSAPSGQGTVWLSPEMLNFDQPFEVSIKGKVMRKIPALDVQVLLEDVRTRGDRQHPFWNKVSWPEQR